MKACYCIILSFLLVLLSAAALSQTNPALLKPPLSTPSQGKVVESYGKLPLSFEANQGQTDARVKFLSRGSGYTLFLTGGGEAVLSLRGRKSGESATPVANLSMPAGLPAQHGANLPATMSVLRIKLRHANHAAKVTGEDELAGKSNYFIGNDPKKWRSNVANYTRIRYRDVYPGIDLVYYGNQGQLEYDWVVSPGADPRAIAFKIDGAQKVELDAQGDLVLRAEIGDVRIHKPLVYQEQSSGGRDRQFLDGRYRLAANHQVRFEVRKYDKSKLLIIDPVMVLYFSTYLGGSGDDAGFGIAVDSSGNAYVTGDTASTNFPTMSPLQPANAGGYDAFVAKLNSTGSALVYSTYLGGSEDDYGRDIAVDGSGNAFVSGETWSTDFPTMNPLQPANGGNADAFVAKLNPSGSALVYSTYLGGSGEDDGANIAVDSSGNAYVSGDTASTDFPTMTPLQPANAGGRDAFVAKLNPTGSALVYSTYLGGSGDDVNMVGAGTGGGIAVDSSGNAYVAGSTSSTDFPTMNPLQPANAGGYDAFVAKINPRGSALVYSTYLGGNGDDHGSGIALDSSGNAYVTGDTASTNFPTMNPLQPANGGNGDAFVAKLNPTGSALVYSTYLGGSGDDEGIGITVDRSGNAYIVGATSSTNFPTMNPSQPVFGGGGDGDGFGAYDAFVAKINPTGSALVYSTYLGGNEFDSGIRLAVDSSGNAYVTGWTNSTNFPTMNPLQPAFGGGRFDTFVTKLGFLPPGPDLTISKSHPGNFWQGEIGATYAIIASNIGSEPSTGAVTVDDTLPAGLTATAMVGSGWTCFVSTLTCTRSDVVSAGASYPAITLTVNVASDAPPTVINTATVAGGGDVYLGDNTATDPTTISPPPAPDLTIFKTHSGNFTVGQVGATYTITVSNVGSLQSMGTVAVTDTLPASLTATTMAGTGWTCVISTLTCTRSDVVNAGASYPAITLTVNVASNAPWSVINTATVAGGGDANLSNNTANDPTIIEGPPTVDSVTPAAALGTDVTFTLAYSAHGTGYADLSWVEMLFNTTITGVNGCYIIYRQPSNSFYLENEAGTGWLGPLTPGSAGTLSNNRCTINGAGTTASGVGQTLTLNLSLAAGSGLIGTQNTYMWVRDSEGLQSVWQTMGTWTVGPDLPPTVNSVTPAAATGSNVTFTLAYFVQNGYTNVNWAEALFNADLTGLNGCYVAYKQPTNSLYLGNDAGTGWLGPLTPGSTGTLSNNECTVNGTGTTVSGSGQTLTLNLSLTAASGFIGIKNTYMWVNDSNGSTSGWQTMGTWTPAADPPPTADSVTPAAATGVNVTFALAYSTHNGKGYTDLDWAEVLFNTTVTGINGCYVAYYQPTNVLYLENEAGTGWLGPLAPGSVGTLSNNQCTVNGAGTTVVGVGPTLTLSLSLSAAGGFSGAKNTYMWVNDVDSTGAGSGWQLNGTWTPQ